MQILVGLYMVHVYFHFVEDKILDSAKSEKLDKLNLTKNSLDELVTYTINYNFDITIDNPVDVVLVRKQKLVENTCYKVPIKIFLECVSCHIILSKSS